MRRLYHYKVRPERLTEKVPAMPVKFICIEQPCPFSC